MPYITWGLIWDHKKRTIKRDLKEKWGTILTESLKSRRKFLNVPQ